MKIPITRLSRSDVAEGNPPALASNPHGREVLVQGEAGEVEQQAMDAINLRERWETIQLLGRKLGVAAAAEDYAEAARLRDLCDLLVAELPPASQILMETAGRMMDGETVAERVTAAHMLEQLGDRRALPWLKEALLVKGKTFHKAVEAAMWALFWHSGDDAVDMMMAEGRILMARGQLESGTLDSAVDIFTRVIEAKPDYAEGYNQRATCLFLLGRNRDSIEDCTATLALVPYHFGALSGMGLCYTKLEEFPAALEVRLFKALGLVPSHLGHVLLHEAGGSPPSSFKPNPPNPPNPTLSTPTLRSLGWPLCGTNRGLG